MRKIKKIQYLINLLFESEKGHTDAFSRNMEIGEKLVRFRTKFFSFAFEKLRALKEENGSLFSYEDSCGSPVFHLIVAMAEVSTRSQAKDLMEILLWDEIAIQEQDRSIRGDLLEAIKRNGDKTLIPSLLEFSEKVKGVHYTDSNDIFGRPFIAAAMYYKWDQEEISETIAACQAH